MAILDNLEAHWRLEESSGTRIDVHGSNNLEPVNAPGNRTGKIGNGCDFIDASTQYLSGADTASLTFGDEDMTIISWVLVDDTTGTKSFLNKFRASDNNREYGLFVVNDLIDFRASSTGSGPIQVMSDFFGSISTGVWYFVHAFHDSTTNELGISINNGTPNTSAFAGGIFEGDAEVLIGISNAGLAFNHDGGVDSTSVWRRRLTDAEVTKLYNNGLGLDYPFDGTNLLTIEGGVNRGVMRGVYGGFG